MAILSTPRGEPQAPVAGILEANKQTDTGIGANEVAAPASPAPEPAISPQLAQMIRREKALRQRDREYQSEKKQWEAEREAKRAELESATAFRQRLAQQAAIDPVAALAELGISGDQFTQALLNQPNPQSREILQLKAEIAALKSYNEQSQKQAEEQGRSQFETGKKQILAEVNALINSNEEYETLKSMGAQDAVFDLIKSTLDKEGYLIPVEQAANEIEEYLVEEALKFARLKKIQAKLAPPAEAPKPAPTQAEKQQMRTLSNRQTVSTAQPSTAKDRIARAIAAFNGGG